MPHLQAYISNRKLAIVGIVTPDVKMFNLDLLEIFLGEATLCKLLWVKTHQLGADGLEIVLFTL